MKASLSTQEQRFVHALQLLGDKTRFKMFKLMSQNHELCVGEIAKNLEISTSAVSQHFRQFELVGIVDKERMGQKICYCLKDTDPFVMKLTKFIKEK